MKRSRAAGRLGVPACVLTFEPHPREFFSPDQAPARLTSLREKLELLAKCGVDRVHVCRFNYALAQTSAEEFVERILVRHFKQPRIDNHLRITIGTQAECEALVDALRHILSTSSSAGAPISAPIGTP